MLNRLAGYVFMLIVIAAPVFPVLPQDGLQGFRAPPSGPASVPAPLSPPSLSATYRREEGAIYERLRASRQTCAAALSNTVIVAEQPSSIPLGSAKWYSASKAVVSEHDRCGGFFSALDDAIGFYGRVVREGKDLDITIANMRWDMLAGEALGYEHLFLRASLSLLRSPDR